MIGKRFFKIAIIVLHTAYSSAVHVSGKWNTGIDRIKVVTKFGFQQTVALDRKNTRGFVFGNITSSKVLSADRVSTCDVGLLSRSSSTFGSVTQCRRDNEVASTRRVVTLQDAPLKIDDFLFALVPQTLVGTLSSTLQYSLPCSVMMQNISKLGFESRCLKDGRRGDIFRWVPCINGQLCREEDDPDAVVHGFQMTMQVEEPLTAEYWYVVLLGCKLNGDCKWISSDRDAVLDYDIWLTNGRPGSDATSLLTLQFSFDKQDTLEIYVVTFLLYVTLSAVMSRGLHLIKSTKPPAHLRLLSLIVVIKTVGVALQCLNVYVFALDGHGLFLARILGDLFRMAGIELLWLLLLLLSRGWVFYPETSVSARSCVILWAILTMMHFLLFTHNFVFLYDTLHEVDVFSSWSGYGQLFIRILLALWFLVGIRKLITREQNEERAAFIAHIGAGFLVWFVYLPGLDVVALFISQLWRFRIILGITTFANYVIIACLIHLFWPSSSYRKFFYSDLYMHRRMDRAESKEIHSFEKLLSEANDSEEDVLSLDTSNSSFHMLL